MNKIAAALLFTIHYSLFTLCSAQETALFSFADTNGIYPEGDLTFYNGTLYGMTSYGGIYNNGCIFSIDTNLNNYKVLYNFDDSLGETPYGSLTLVHSGIRSRFFGLTSGGGAYLKGCIFCIDTDGNHYKILHNFDTDGAAPHGNLTLFDSTLYGITSAGGLYNYGCIFSIDTNGNAYTILHNFNDTAGATSYGSLLFAGSVLYGITYYGGVYDSGCIFSVNLRQPPDSNYKDLHDFNDTMGGNPSGNLILLKNKLYGMASRGGILQSGCMFSIDTNGRGYNVLMDFYDSSGTNPHGSLTLSANKFYGMTGRGASYNSGCLFSLDTDIRNYKKLLVFNSFNGAYPYGGVAVSGQALYGMTEYGGSNNVGVIFSIDTNAVFSSVNEVSATPEIINLYPNPNNGIFNVVCHSERSEESPVIIDMYNVLGEKVITETLRYAQGDNLIDMTGQPNGIYFYRVISETGGLIGIGKFSIEK